MKRVYFNMYLAHGPDCSRRLAPPSMTAQAGVAREDCVVQPHLLAAFQPALYYII